MLSRKPKPAASPAAPSNPTQQLNEAAMDWEASRTHMLEKSERRAWTVAAAAGGVAVLAWIAIALMMPLKESVPYLYRVDALTGVPDIVEMLDAKNVGSDEVMNKYWLAKYVQHRETYNWFTLQSDYDAVGLMSTPMVGKVYADQFGGKDALDKKYADKVSVTVKIISVVPTGPDSGTVRFQKTTKRIDDDGPGAVTKYIATVSFIYNSASKLKESQRLINPFGFQVNSYRVDPEMMGGS